MQTFKFLGHRDKRVIHWQLAQPPYGITKHAWCRPGKAVVGMVTLWKLARSEYICFFLLRLQTLSLFLSCVLCKQAAIAEVLSLLTPHRGHKQTQGPELLQNAVKGISKQPQGRDCRYHPCRSPCLKCKETATNMAWTSVRTVTNVAPV